MAKPDRLLNDSDSEEEVADVEFQARERKRPNGWLSMPCATSHMHRKDGARADVRRPLGLLPNHQQPGGKPFVSSGGWHGAIWQSCPSPRLIGPIPLFAQEEYAKQ